MRATEEKNQKIPKVHAQAEKQEKNTGNDPENNLEKLEKWT